MQSRTFSLVGMLAALAWSTNAAELFPLQELAEEIQSVREDLNSGQSARVAERARLGARLQTAEDDLLRFRRELERALAQASRTADRIGEPTEDASRSRRTLDYAKTSLRDFTVYFESRVHLAEIEKYRPALDAARVGKRAGEASSASRLELWGDVLDAALDHCESLPGGRRQPGIAARPPGEPVGGEFFLLGPLAYFAATNAQIAGFVTLPANSLEFHVLDAGAEAASAVTAFAWKGSGILPIDAASGNAALLQASRDTLAQHISKGGPVMIGILALGAAALFVALSKLIQVFRCPRTSERELAAILRHLSHDDEERAVLAARKLPGPEGELILAGVVHAHEDPDSFKLALENSIARARARLECAVPFIAVAAAMAPLFGLLGTVTGMINTFKLISVFGAGNPRMLSSGISESLVTTEFGLIIAVPALLLHACVNGRVKRLMQSMESIAMRMVVCLQADKKRRRPPLTGESPTPSADSEEAGDLTPLPAA